MNGTGKLFLLKMALLLAGLSSLGKMASADAAPPDRMQWFSDAKFGMFIHWGPYSRLAGEWNGRLLGNDRNAEWIMNFLEIPRDEYRKAAREFNPVEFDARDWVGLARAAGMKYLVFTSKHHDGFAMYGSGVSDYNIRDWSGFGKDPLRDLAEECRRNGIRFGFYYSQREDWDEPFAYGNTWDFDFDPEQDLAAFERRYLETKAEPQLRELLTGYGPIDLIWFDRGLYTQEQAGKLRGLVASLQPDCLVNGRIGNYDAELMGDFQDLNDNGMPASGIEEYWETPQTLNDTWGYSRFDNNWKQPGDIIRRLVEIVSKGGNYLLNIGPDGLGRIPGPSREILLETGRWIGLYGESIYGTAASPMAEADWGFCTRKGNLLYLQVTDWPENGEVTLDGLRNRVVSAWPLADPGRSLTVLNGDSGPVIDLDGVPRDRYVSVIKLELDGPPRVDPPVVGQSTDGSFLLNYETAVTRGRAVKRFNRKGGYHIAGMESAGDYVEWHLGVTRPGSYRVRITYSVLPSRAGHGFRASAGRERLEARTEGTGDWYDYRTFDLGSLSLGREDDQVLDLSPVESCAENLMFLKELILEPEP